MSRRGRSNSTRKTTFRKRENANILKFKHLIVCDNEFNYTPELFQNFTFRFY